MRWLAIVLLLLACAAPQAQETVFYKCTDAKGSVSMQNGTPCAPGTKQEIRHIGAVKVVPVPAAKPAAAEPPAAPPQYGEFVMVGGPSMQHTPAPEAAVLPPPSALFQCRTWEGDTYYGESATPEPRCAPLQVLGIDGSAALGMGQACEMKHDTCTEVPAAQLCAAWYRQLDEADFKLRYADGAERNDRQVAFDGISAKIKVSNCALATPALPASTKPAASRVP